jgi:hypothetical protein
MPYTFKLYLTFNQVNKKKQLQIKLRSISSWCNDYPMYKPILTFYTNNAINNYNRLPNPSLHFSNNKFILSVL